jgi:hypothetical protein
MAGGLARARMNRKTRSSRSLGFELFNTQRGRRHAKGLRQRSNPPKLTIVFNKLHNAANL